MYECDGKREVGKRRLEITEIPLTQGHDHAGYD